jgi:hypothetical protein
MDGLVLHRKDSVFLEDAQFFGVFSLATPPLRRGFTLIPQNGTRGLCRHFPRIPKLKKRQKKSAEFWRIPKESPIFVCAKNKVSLLTEKASRKIIHRNIHQFKFHQL